MDTSLFLIKLAGRASFFFIPVEWSETYFFSGKKIGLENLSQEWTVFWRCNAESNTLFL